jgi:hypothetical protein
MDKDALTRRATAAYLRSERDGMPIVGQPHGGSGVVERDGRAYVLLHNAVGTLAVYRVRNSGQLRRLRRWPAEVAER